MTIGKCLVGKLHRGNGRLELLIQFSGGASFSGRNILYSLLEIRPLGQWSVLAV